MSVERYYVKRPTGKIFGPFDKNAIQLMLKSNKLDANAEVSHDKISWMPLSDVPDFAQHIRAEGRPGGTIMGMTAVTMDDLPHPVSPSYVDLPQPSMGADLPRPVGGADLPRPVNNPGYIEDLPGRPSGHADLPRPATGASLPAPSSGLPTPARPPLPVPGTGLPTPSRPPLPKPAQHTQEEDLFGAPMSMVEEDDLFGSPPVHAQEDDLFGAPSSSPPPQTHSPFMGNATPASEEDLFGGQMSQGEDDLFGAPPEPSREDDLFGAPSEPSEALFGAPSHAHQHSAPAIEEDIFGGQGSNDLDADDLFGSGDAIGGDEGSESLYNDEDDFLGGSQGFSFLDDGGAQNNAPQMPAQDEPDDWEQDLLGNATQQESWHDDLLTGNAPPMGTSPSPTPQSHSPYGSAAPSSSGSSAPPQQPASTGIPAQSIASTGIPAATPETQQQGGAKGQSKVADGDKKRNKMVMIGVPVLIVLILAVGALAVQRFMADDTPTGPTVTKEVKAFTLAYDQLQAPNFAVIQQMSVQSKKGKMNEQVKGRLLLAHALMVALHEDEASLKAGQELAKQLAAAKGNDALLGRGALLVTEGKYDDAKPLLEPLLAEDGGVGAFANLFMGIVTREELRTLRKMVPAPPSEDTPEEGTPENKEEGTDKKVADKEEEDTGAEGEVPEKVEPTDKMVETEKAAVAYFDKAAAWHATLPELLEGSVYELLGDLENATKHYKVAAEKTPDFVPAQVSLGRVRYRQGELNAAIENFNHVNNDLVQYAHPKEKGEALHYAGLVFSARSQHNEAIDYFTKALTNDPSRSDTLRALAEEYERAQQYKEALNFFKTNKKLGQSDPDVMLGIVRAHIGLKEWAQAIAQLEVGEKKFPTDARFPYYLGELNRRRGAFFESQKSLERAVEIDPTLLMAHAMLAQLAWRTDQDTYRGDKHIHEIVARPEQIDARVATEVAEYYKLSGNYALAKQWYNAAIKRDPNYWAARLPLARLLLESGETKEALSLLERSRNEGVTDIKLSAYLADAYRQSKLYDKAIDEINKVIEKVPSKDNVQRAEYVFIRGRVYYDRGNFDTALEDFNQAFTLNTNFYDANFYVGRTKLAQGDTATAIKIFRSVLDYLPNNGEYRFAMGQALQKEERYSQALNEYRKVTEVDPGYGVRNPKVYITRGRLLSKLGYSRDGRKDIQKALELAPEMIEALIAMGEVDFREQRYQEAIKNFTKALNKSPKYPDAQYKLGMAHIYLEELRNGAQHLELAVKYDYEDPDVYRTLGYVYKQLGETARAKQAFNAFLQKALTTEQPLGTTKEVRRQIKELEGK